jgi:hypothetical protein
MTTFYAPVTGPVKSGAQTTIAPGDMVTAHDTSGQLVTGTVIATHPYYPSVVIDGIGGFGGDIYAGRFSVHVSKVLTHLRQPQHIGQRA